LTSEIRVEALPFGDHYLAVFRETGTTDVILDGPDGRPQRFTSAYAAITAGKATLVPAAAGLKAQAKTFRADRTRGADEERRSVFSAFDRGEP
jgi:molybdopterin/thiamine biosynthesis adenylyltransferase